MGLSKRNRIRRSDSNSEERSNELILRYTQAIQPAIFQAIRTRVWLEGMQKQLKYTSLALRDRPAAALAHFQKTLGRPSYFLTSTPSNHWVVLLGPRTSAPTAKVLIPAALPVPAPVKKAFPGWVKRLDRIPSQVIRFAAVSWEVLRQWLMHPVIDSRDSLQDDSVR